MLHQLEPSHHRRQHQHQNTLHQDNLAPHSSPSSFSPSLHASTPLDSALQAPSIAPTIAAGLGQDPVQGRHSAVHHWPFHQDMSAMLEPPSPLLLNPTIVASQSQPPKPNPFPPHLSQYQDHGMVHPHHQHLQQQPQLHHHRSVFQLQQQYNNQSNDEGERGRAGDNAAQAVHRKRSHSVPLLQQQLAAASSSLEPPHQQEGPGGQGGQGEGQGDDDDQDMEGADDEGVTTITAMTLELMSDGPRTNGSATVYDYSALALPRESLLATLPRTHRDRDYAADAPSDSTLASSASDQPHPHALYYTLPTQSRAPALRFSRNNFAHSNHRHHGTSLYRENNYIRNRFPPYQHWPQSAQRDFHMATMGPLNTSGSPTSGISRSGLLSPASVLGTDAVLRSAIASTGSINKAAAYKSRLPVHLRHMTPRSNRRSAICVNPFQPDQNASPHRQPQPQRVNISTPSNISAMTVGLTDTDRLNPASVLSPRPLTPITTFNAANVAAAAALETMNQRKRISDWKRVSVQVYDLDENDPRQGIMRLNNGGIIGGGTVYSSGSSSSLLGSTSSGGGGAHSMRGRQWMNQRSGLMNLTRAGPPGIAKSAGTQGARSAGQGSSGTSQSGSTVDRLVEEMNKWSV